MYQKSVSLDKNDIQLQNQMIKDIIRDYFEFREFFRNNNKDFRLKEFSLKDYTPTKEDFVARKVNEFQTKFKDYSLLRIMPSGKFLSIPVKNGVFIYPKSFTRFLDRIKDINSIPVHEIDPTPIDEFMGTFPINNNYNLEFFLIRFFEVVKFLNIPLRPREVEILRIFTNINFLRFKSDGLDRFYPPSQTELLKILDLKKSSRLQILRSKNILYNYRICYPDQVIMNPAKHGFFFTSFDIKKEKLRDLECLQPFIFWKFDFQDFSTIAACVPFGNLEDLLGHYDYTPLLNWQWSINSKYFLPRKYSIKDAWNSFSVPKFSTLTVSSNEGVNWDIRPEFNTYTINELEVIKNLSKTSIMNLRSYENLTDKISPAGVRKIAQRLIKKEIFQLYPGINHINLQNIICLKFETKNKELFQNIKNNLLLFPISHVLYNEEDGKILSYIHIPKEFIYELVFQLKDLETVYPEVSVNMKPLMNNYYVSRCLRLYQIDFSVKNGVAYLN
ncbi:MAG: hypothetical protein ACW981_03905 [Candidatus Hodarchaeales archaeon]|jgi:hypothetical protein